MTEVENAAAAERAGVIPLVSVCVPAYNGESHIAEALESVLSQTYRHFELVVVDDDSNDGTVDIVRSFRDPRLSIIRNTTNLGPAANWNKALALARGKYVKVFHQDDLLGPDCLARQVEVLEQNAGVALVFSSREIVNAEGRRLFTRSAPWRDGPIDAQSVVTACVRAGTNVLGEPSASLFRRDIALVAGGFNSAWAYLIDLDYWVRLLRHGDAYYLSKPLASFRVSAGSSSIALWERQAREFSGFVDHLAAERVFRVSAMDRLRGTLTARVNAWLRGCLYLLVIRRRPRRGRSTL